MEQTTNLDVRIDSETKEQAESILNTLEISPSCAITMFYKQIVLRKGIPFEVKLPESPEQERGNY